MTRSTSIRLSLLVNLTAMIALAGGAMIGATVYATRQLTETLTREIIEHRLATTEVELRHYFRPVAAAVRTAAAWGDEGLLDRERPAHLVRLLRPLVDQLPQLAALRIADADGSEFMLLRATAGWRTREIRRGEWGSRARWHTWRDDASPPRVQWQRLEYDPRRQPWFRGAEHARIPLNPGPAPARARRLTWTDPGILSSSERSGLTVSTSFGPTGERRRVIALDVHLAGIARFTGASHGGGTGTVALFTRDARLIAPRVATASTSAGHAWPIGAAARAALSVPATERPVRSAHAGEHYWGARRLFRLDSGQALSVVAVVREKAVLGALLELRVWVAGLIAAVLSVALLRAIMLSRRYSRPMEALVEETERMSLGNLEEGPAIDSRVTEIRRLAESHARMRAGLRSLMRIEDDLRVARRIQQNTLPDRIPYLHGFDIHAFSEPAEETGGDTYDVVGYRADASGRAMALSVENANRALLLLADATGHGVGPALSATQLRAMLRMAVRTGTRLDHIVHNVNEQLCDDLFGGRFITAWLAIVNTEDGTLTSLSAGQAPMFHHHADTGRTETLGADTPPLGIARDLAFPAPPPRRMAPGDIFAVLSDGVLESTDADGGPFGEARAVEVIVRHRRETAGLILTRLRQAVARHTTGTRPSDDRTAIVVKREPL